MKPKHYNTGTTPRWNGSLTVGNSSVDGVGEGAHVSVGGRSARRTPDAPWHDACEIRSAARCAGHWSAAVARTRVRVACSARAQHRRVHCVAVRLERIVTRGKVHDAHSCVEQHIGRAAACAQIKVGIYIYIYTFWTMILWHGRSASSHSHSSDFVN